MAKGRKETQDAAVTTVITGIELHLKGGGIFRQARLGREAVACLSHLLLQQRQLHNVEVLI